MHVCSTQMFLIAKYRIKGNDSIKETAVIVSRTNYDWLRRAEGKIKHCRVQQEGQLVILGNSEFDSLVDLISYFEKHPLYRKMKLRYPINEETLEKIGTAVSLMHRSISSKSNCKWCIAATCKLTCFFCLFFRNPIMDLCMKDATQDSMWRRTRCLRLRYILLCERQPFAKGHL